MDCNNNLDNISTDDKEGLHFLMYAEAMTFRILIKSN